VTDIGSYRHLLSPLRIRNTTLPNRVVFAPVCPTWVRSPHEGIFTEQAVAYYEERAKTGLGMIILGVLLMIICLSLIIIAWDTCRPPPPQRRSSYLEFDPAGLEGHVPDTSHRELLAAKKTLISYGLAVFCLYVTDPFFVSDFRLAYSQILQ